MDCSVDSTTTFFKCRGADSCPFWIKALGEKLSAASFSIETAAPEKCNVSTFFSTAWADKGSTVAVLSSTGPDSAGWRNSHPGNTISSKALHKRACSLIYSHLLSHTVCCCSYHSTAHVVFCMFPIMYSILTPGVWTASNDPWESRDCISCLDIPEYSVLASVLP